MGREFLSQAFVQSPAPIFPTSPSSETRARSPPTMAGEPRTWSSKDAIWPEDDQWWNSQDVVYEAFVDGPVAGSSAAPAPSQTDAPDAVQQHTAAPDSLEDTLPEPTSNSAAENDIAPAEVSGSKPVEDQVAQAEAEAEAEEPGLPIPRYTITEEELADVSLDFLPSQSPDDSEEEEDEGTDSDFALEWDSMDEDSDADMVDETPPPSTPVSFASTLAVSVSIPSTPDETVTYATPTTPRAVQLPVHGPSSSLSTPRTKNVHRVRGFALESPRTGLVL